MKSIFSFDQLEYIPFKSLFSSINLFKLLLLNIKLILFEKSDGLNFNKF